VCTFLCVFGEILVFYRDKAVYSMIHKLLTKVERFAVVDLVRVLPTCFYTGTERYF